MYKYLEGKLFSLHVEQLKEGEYRIWMNKILVKFRE